MYDYNICDRCYSEMIKKYIPKIDAAIWVCPNCYNVEPCGYDPIVSEVYLEQEIDTNTKRYYYQEKFSELLRQSPETVDMAILQQEDEFDVVYYTIGG